MPTQSITSSPGDAIALASEIEARIVEGRLAAGDRLEPIRTLAVSLGLAPNTVASAYRRLGERGLVVGRGRKGTYVSTTAVPFRPDVPVPPGLIDLASGNPDPTLLPSIDHSIRATEHEQVLYGAATVLPQLEAASRRIFGHDEAPLAVVGGVLDGIERALSAVMTAGARVAVEAPGWPVIVAMVRSLGLRPVPVAIDDRGFTPEAIATANVDAVVITTRAQNPTGAAVDHQRARQLCKAIGASTLVIEDDHGALLDSDQPFLVGPHVERWAAIHGVSKSLGPDLRTAVLFGDEQTVGAVRSRQAAGAGWVSVILQRTVASMLDDPAVGGQLEDARRIYRDRRESMIQALARHGVEAAGRSGFNVWVPVSDEHRVMVALANAGYAIRLGETFRFGTPPAVRITTSRISEAQADDVASIISTQTSGSIPAMVRTRTP